MKVDNHHPICPKCGYDQSGEIATWENQCPMHGQCPECGLEFAWANVMDPSRVDVRWYVEHAHSKWSILKRALPTLWYLIIPNRFWRRVSLVGQIRIGRLALFVMSLLCITHMLSSLSLGLSIYESAREHNIRLTRYAVSRPSQANYFKQQKIDFHEPAYWIDLCVVSLAHPYRGLLDSEFAERAGMFIIAGISSVALWCLILGVVPTTRTIAKLRYSHVVRAMMLSMVGLIVLLLLGRMSDAIEQLSSLWIYSVDVEDFLDSLSDFAPTVLIAFGVLYLIWIQWLWVTAIRIGWQVRPSVLLILLGMIASLLGGALGITISWAQ